MHRPTHTAFFSLGANLGERERTIRHAARALADALRATDVALSPLYETAPMYVTDQPAFVNAALRLRTPLGARRCLHVLHEVETRFGRVRRERYGPRTLDIDLLGLDDLRLVTPELALPHPRLAERGFVLVPLADIAPDWAPPLAAQHERATVAALLRALDASDVRPLSIEASA